MKPKYDVKMLKNLGQFIVAPVLGLMLAIIAVRAGSIPGGFAFIFGGFVWMAMTFVVLVIFDKLVIKKCVAANEQYEKEYKDKIHRLMEEDNAQDAYDEYNDTGFIDDRFEEEKTGLTEYEKQKLKQKEEAEKAKEAEGKAVLRELDYDKQTETADEPAED
jgi:hypothetical protein